MRSEAKLLEIVPPDVERQVAALVWRRIGMEAQILLVTSRVSGRWLLPKGWLMEGKSPAEAAVQEAFEEAGVWGISANHPVGSFGYRKLLTDGALIDCVVDVFAVEAIDILGDWPEQSQRCREWVTPSQAAKLVMERDLARFLGQCDAQFIDQHFRTRSLDVAPSGYPSRLPLNKMKDHMMINAAQCRAARALIDWSIDHLAAASGVPVEQLISFEGDGTLDRASNAQVARALEGGGASFMSERRGRGVGVRLKFGRQLAKRIDIWENEGGPTGDDDNL